MKLGNYKWEPRLNNSLSELGCVMATFEIQQLKITTDIEIVLRPLVATDAEQMLQFRKQIAAETTNTMQYVGQEYPATEEAVKRLTTQLEDKTTVNIGAFDESKLIAYLNFRMPWAEHPWTPHLAQFGMMVLKDYWGQGVGKKLLQMQEQHAEHIGVRRIEAMVRVANDRGITLYERNGYKIEGTRKNAAFINGSYVDEYFIAKILDDPFKNWQPPTLVTSRLVLRPITLNDAADIFSYAKNPSVSKFTLWEPHTSLSDSVDYIKDYIFDYYSKGVPEPLGIALKSNPAKVIGTVGCFWVSKKAKSMELAYAIGEEHWGQGLVAEASVTMMDYCFKEFSLKRLQARCKSENKASSRVMEKIGMNFEGTLKAAVFHREKFCDMHYYAKVSEASD